MAIKLEDPKEYIAALGDMSSLLGGNLGLGSANIANLNNVGRGRGSFLGNIANILKQQQAPILGPDDFGSYVIPASDPTYSSGFDYARSIAGGIPMSQVIAPGVSYSPEQPMGYTQEQLNIPRDVEKLTPPRFIDRETGRDRFSINRLPGDLPNFAKLGIDFVPGPEGAKPGILGNIDFANLPQKGFFSFDPENFKMLQNMGGAFDFDQDAIEKIVQERIAESKKIQETKPDMPTFIPEVPTGRDFSIDREILERPMISGLENKDLMDVDSLITGVPTGRGFSVDREPIPLQDFGYGPGIMPPTPPMDINKLIPPVDLPPINITDLPPVDLPPINIPPRIPLDLPIVRPPTIMDELTGGKFSINQQRPMGLF